MSKQEDNQKSSKMNKHGIKPHIFSAIIFGTIGLGLLISGLVLELLDVLWPGIGYMLAIFSAFPLLISLLIFLSILIPRLS